MKTGSKRGIRITARTAALSWLVAIGTLLIFVSAIIPQQKRTFLENLQSKALGVAVSLHDVAGAALENEDYPSVVDHCKEMITGDKALSYIVMTKNDGFSLIHDRRGWRSEANVPKEWHPDKREVTSGIGLVPLMGQRAFQYSLPFDYSGIQWGWMHIGISLDSYDRSVSMVYRRTGELAVVCVLLSLLASVIYAKRLVRPILELRTVVQKVAGGDLSARAADQRGDELGSLAGSVNIMTEALLRRDKILESVRFAAQQFLSTSNWKGVIEGVLANLGQAALVSRIRVFENRPNEDQGVLAWLGYEWAVVGRKSFNSGSDKGQVVLRSADFSSWAELLKRKETVSVNLSELD